MMSKLTLSLPEKTILEVKQIAKRRKTTVSALFAESLRYWRMDSGGTNFTSADSEVEMSDLLGALDPQAAFDSRSTRIRQKHG